MDMKLLKFESLNLRHTTLKRVHINYAFPDISFLLSAFSKEKPLKQYSSSLLSILLIKLLACSSYKD